MKKIPFFLIYVAQDGEISQKAERLVAAFQFTYLYIFKYIGIDRKIIQSFLIGLAMIVINFFNYDFVSHG